MDNNGCPFMCTTIHTNEKGTTDNTFRAKKTQNCHFVVNARRHCALGRIRSLDGRRRTFARLALQTGTTQVSVHSSITVGTSLTIRDTAFVSKVHSGALFTYEIFTAHVVVSILLMTALIVAPSSHRAPLLIVMRCSLLLSIKTPHITYPQVTAARTPSSH